MKDGLFIPGEALASTMLIGIALLIVAAYMVGYYIGKDDKPK